MKKTILRISALLCIAGMLTTSAYFKEKESDTPDTKD